jgi:hypothetical protein
MLLTAFVRHALRSRQPLIPQGIGSMLMMPIAGTLAASVYVS